MRYVAQTLARYVSGTTLAAHRMCSCQGMTLNNLRFHAMIHYNVQYDLEMVKRMKPQPCTGIEFRICPCIDSLCSGEAAVHPSHLVPSHDNEQLAFECPHSACTEALTF